MGGLANIPFEAAVLRDRGLEAIPGAQWISTRLGGWFTRVML